MYDEAELKRLRDLYRESEHDSASDAYVKAIEDALMEVKENYSEMCAVAHQLECELSDAYGCD